MKMTLVSVQNRRNTPLSKRIPEGLLRHLSLVCFLVRMITEFGCDGTFRWTIRWRDICAARPGNLLDQLADRGGFCDCEVLMNVYPDYPPVSAPVPCAGVPKPGSSRACDLRPLRKSA